MKSVINIGIVVLAALLTFFGLGPIFFADGTMGERIITLIAVLGGYALLIAVYMWAKKQKFR